MVGEELEGDDGRNGGDERVAARDGDEVVHALGRCVIAGSDDAEDARATCAAFLDVAESFILAGNVAGKGDDGSAFFQQGDGAVLELGSVVAFRVDVGNFLELERAFEGDGIHRAATDEECVLVLRVVCGDLCDARVLLDHLGDERGDGLNFPGELDAFFA